MVKWVAYYFTDNDDKSVTIRNSEERSITSSNPQELLDFLYIHFRDYNNREIKYTYDIDESLSLIFRLLTVDELRGILNTKNGSHYNLLGYEVSYSRERNFIIRGSTLIQDRPYWSCLYHLKQYVREFDEPTNVQELNELGLKVKKALENIGITTPTTLNSPISIWESSMRKTESTMIQNIDYIPSEQVRALEFAEKCAQHQGWITNIQVGHFKKEELHSYDISSAYGYWLSQSRDFTAVTIDRYSPNYAYKHLIYSGDVTGYFQCDVTIYPHIKLHPFAYKTPQDDIIYPTGTFTTYLIAEEILSLVKNKIGKVKILDGYYFRFLNHGKPMQHIIERLFNKRSLGIIENDICKAIIVQMVGKSLMVNKDTGEPSKTYNPPLVGWIYSMCRLQDFEFILKNHLEDSTVAICTDEVISTQKAEITPIESGAKVMGTWREKEQTPMFVLSPGWILSGSKKPHSLTYDTLKDMIKKEPTENHYKYPVKERITLYKAVETLEDISKVGEYHQGYNTIDLIEIQARQDRLYSSFPNNGKQLISGNKYTSEPIKI